MYNECVNDTVVFLEKEICLKDSCEKLILSISQLSIADFTYSATLNHNLKAGLKSWLGSWEPLSLLRRSWVQSSVPTWQHTTPCISSSKVFEVLCWPLGHEVLSWRTYIYTQAQHSGTWNNKISNSKNSFLKVKVKRQTILRLKTWLTVGALT